MGKRGPKLIDINWEQFDKLCYMQCTSHEIAAWFNCSVDTLENRLRTEKGKKFSDYYKEKKEIGRISLRRAQYQAATEKGNITMMIWLGKQYLGQTEKIEQDVNVQEIKINKDEENL